MIIQYCSDLHLEFPANDLFLKNNPLKVVGDILILAGDIIPLNRVSKRKEFFDYISANFKETYWIPGNHEYYHTDISLWAQKQKFEIRDKVFLVNNFTMSKDSYRIVFSTLWSRISLLNAWQIERAMNDFHVITSKQLPFNTQDYNDLHKESLTFIQNELETEFTGKTIVVTHHVPTLQNYPPEYLGGVLNQAFAVNLDNLIYDTKPDFWIYGHHHRNVSEFKIGKTLMLTNQLGYVHLGENKNFLGGKTIVI
jgi:predicted phosphohydrolase